jgi:hypothetical protein
MLVVYDYDGNCIDPIPMPNRKGSAIDVAYKKTSTFLESREFKPLLKHLDNKALLALQSFMDESNIEFQLAPPDVHQHNAVERTIRTFKNHFIAGLSSTNTNFPLNLWE